MNENHLELCTSIPSQSNPDTEQEEFMGKKLIEFYVIRPHTAKAEEPISHIKKHYCIYGTYTWDEANGIDGNSFLYPEFDDLHAFQIVDGEKIPYTPTGSSWSHKFNVYDMINSALATEIWGTTAKTYKTLYLDNELQDFVNSFRSEENYLLSASGLKVYKYILASDLSHQYTLSLVTDTCIYYVDDESVYALNTSDHCLLSDNAFAEMGYWNSIDAIRNGTEKLLWGELPDTE